MSFSHGRRHVSAVCQRLSWTVRPTAVNGCICSLPNGCQQLHLQSASFFFLLSSSSPQPAVFSTGGIRHRLCATMEPPLSYFLAIAIALDLMALLFVIMLP
eukprot:c24772_g2_i1 orf=517-819(-)